MPLVILHRQHCSITRPDGRYSVCWVEYWAAGPAVRPGSRKAPSGWTHWRSEPERIGVSVPFGREGIPAGVEGIYYLAVRGMHGYQLAETDEMAKRKPLPDTGPGLFGPAEEEPRPSTASAYPRASPLPERKELRAETAVIQAPPEPLEAPIPFPRAGAALDRADADRARIAELARQAVAEERGQAVRRAELLEAALRRILGQVARGIETGNVGCLATVRTIGEVALEDAGLAAAGSGSGGTEAA